MLYCAHGFFFLNTIVLMVSTTIYHETLFFVLLIVYLKCRFYGCYQFLDVEAKPKRVCLGNEFHRGTCSTPNKCIQLSNVSMPKKNRFGVKPFQCNCTEQISRLRGTTGITIQRCHCKYHCK